MKTLFKNPKKIIKKISKKIMSSQTLLTIIILIVLNRKFKLKEI